MKPLPRELWCVVWNMARGIDRPLDRTEKRRNFSSEVDAAAQVLTLMRWIPTHCELVGVWHTCGYDLRRDSRDRVRGLQWHPVDPATLRCPNLEEEPDMEGAEA